MSAKAAEPPVDDIFWAARSSGIHFDIILPSEEVQTRQIKERRRSPEARKGSRSRWVRNRG
jgi:hypothetical protein